MRSSSLSISFSSSVHLSSVVVFSPSSTSTCILFQIPETEMPLLKFAECNEHAKLKNAACCVEGDNECVGSTSRNLLSSLKLFCFTFPVTIPVPLKVNWNNIAENNPKRMIQTIPLPTQSYCKTKMTSEHCLRLKKFSSCKFSSFIMQYEFPIASKFFEVANEIRKKSNTER